MKLARPLLFEARSSSDEMSVFRFLADDPASLQAGKEAAKRALGSIAGSLWVFTGSLPLPMPRGWVLYPHKIMYRGVDPVVLLEAAVARSSSSLHGAGWESRDVFYGPEALDALLLLANPPFADVVAFEEALAAGTVACGWQNGAYYVLVVGDKQWAFRVVR